MENATNDVDERRKNNHPKFDSVPFSRIQFFAASRPKLAKGHEVQSRSHYSDTHCGGEDLVGNGIFICLSNYLKITINI